MLGFLRGARGCRGPLQGWRTASQPGLQYWGLTNSNVKGGQASPKLAPEGLAGATLKSVFGANPSGLAHPLHAATGMVYYVLGYSVVARPLQRALLPALPWLVIAIIYGLALRIFALYMMAHLVAGLPAFLGITGITWVALWGDIVHAVLAAWVIEARRLAFDPFAVRLDATAAPDLHLRRPQAGGRRSP